MEKPTEALLACDQLALIAGYLADRPFDFTAFECNKALSTVRFHGVDAYRLFEADFRREVADIFSQRHGDDPANDLSFLVPILVAGYTYWLEPESYLRLLGYLESEETVALALDVFATLLLTCRHDDALSPHRKALLGHVQELEDALSHILGPEPVMAKANLVRSIIGEL
jgi:hypothetical protein